MIAAAARQLGCDRETIYDYKKKYPNIDQTLDAEREMQLDRTELQLFMAIDKGEPWAIKLFLTTVGRSRGYTTKQGVGHDGVTLEELVGSLRPRPPKVINGSDPGHTSDGGGALARPGAGEGGAR